VTLTPFVVYREWRYGDALTMRGYGTDILLQYTNGNAVVPNVASNCEEVFAQTDLKRVLAQCRDRTEFAKAFIDFAEGACGDVNA
jgi:hypothetical protein